MKNLPAILSSVILAPAMWSCADDFSDKKFEVAAPEDIAALAYLKDYLPLKEYVNRSAVPDFFKLGTCTNKSGFMNGAEYALVLTNFDEITLGNEFKYTGSVAADGSMDFSTVQSIVEKARNAGISIFGHTLCWHSQQRKGYLEGLIAPEIVEPEPSEPGNGGYCLKLTNPTKKANNYSAQTWYVLPSTLKSGVTYTLTFMGRATADYSCSLYLKTTSDAQQYPGGVNFSTEWTKITKTLTPSTDDVNKIVFNFGDFEGSLFIDDISLTESGSTLNLINNGSFEDGHVDGWAYWTPGQYYSLSEDGEGYSSGNSGGGISETGYCLQMTNTEKKANSYSSQAWYQFAAPLEAGVTYKFTAKAKATDDYRSSIYLQSTSGGSQLYPGAISFGKEWSDVTLSFTPSHDKVDKFTFNFGDFVGTLYLDNVSLTKSGETSSLIPNGDFEEGHIDGWRSWSGYQTLSPEGSGYGFTEGGGQIVEKTDKEKAEILTAELAKWIKGMMEACEGYVSVWDVVNEPISDSAPYDVKHGTGIGNDGDNFYWQDYLGDNYVRTAVALTRKYFAEYGGNPSELKLFINDYNLEASYNNNAKCEGLIRCINRWESDGETVIDGIGTQMHVTYSLDPATQAKNEECVENMYRLLAATGKLIHVSELDMGCNDAQGNSLKTSELSIDDHKKMAEYYDFIVRKYFEIIPFEQQYGIVAWGVTDQPENSYWRAGMPTGIWDINYNRKPAYAGWAEGLMKGTGYSK